MPNVTAAPPSPPRRSYMEGNREKKLYTIHSPHKRCPYSVVLNDGTPHMKSSVVCFSNVEHATQFACLLEGHKRFTKEWPINTFDAHPRFMIFNHNLNNPSHPSELTVSAWDRPIIKAYCYDKAVDLLILSQFVLTPDESYIHGALYKTPLDYDESVMHLHSLFTLD